MNNNIFRYMVAKGYIYVKDPTKTIDENKPTTHSELLATTRSPQYRRLSVFGVENDYFDYTV